MHTLTSFHSSDVHDDQVNAILADYLTLEQVRAVRQLLVTRCGWIAAVIAVAGAGLGWLPRFASWLSVSLFLALPVTVWVVELTRGRSLRRRLEQLPRGIVQAPRRQAP